MASPRRNLGRRWRHIAAVVAGEARLFREVRAALTALATHSRDLMVANGWNVDALDTRDPIWRQALAAGPMPVIEDVFMAAFTDAARGTVLDAEPYRVRHYEAVYNRLVGAADDVFDVIRTQVTEGRLAGEGIPELAARIDTALAEGGAERWAGRATTIARTEVIAANNAGSYDAAGALADALGVPRGAVAKQWLATGDGRTRPTHSDADGQTVVGLSTPFSVGGAELQYAGDPTGPGEEVINCRCTVLHLLPGDPGYPDEGTAMTAAAQEQVNTSTVVVALPAAGDAVNGIGPEQKHSTLLWFGEVDDATGDVIRAAVEAYLTADGAAGPFTVAAEDVELLGDDDPQAVVVHVEAGPLGMIREALLGDDAVRGAWEAQKQWPTFTPHVTLGYGDDVTDDDRATAATLDGITFDRLAVWQGDRQDEYTLGGTMPDPVTAAAGDPAPPVNTDPPEELAAGDPAPDVMMNPDEPGDQFHGIMVLEDYETGDGRVFSPGALDWSGPLLPMPLGWQVEDDDGHEGSVIVGRIDTIERRGNQIVYGGTWDLDGVGGEAHRMVEGLFLRGISVDVDNAEAVLAAPDGTPVDPFMAMFEESEPGVLVVTRGRIRSSALCRVPAFPEAFIANGPLPPGELPLGGVAADAADVMTEDDAAPALAALAAAATYTEAEVLPAEWFSYPGVEALTYANGAPRGLTIDTDTGRVFGYLATWGTCHIGFDGECVTPPTSPSQYAHFAVGVIDTDGGEVPVGQLTMGTGHAGLTLSARPAAAHYDNTGTAVADIATGEDHVGVWFSGALRPGVTSEQVQQMRAAGAVSGDWRPISGARELVAALVVNVPGFPIPRPSVGLAASGRQTALVAAGMVPPTPALTAAVGADPETVARHVLALLDRRQRAEQVLSRARVRRARAVLSRRATI